MRTITVDGTTITELRDGRYEDSSEKIQHRSGEAARRAAIDAFGAKTVGFPVNCFLLRRDDDITLVDAGAGTAWGPAFGHLRGLLAQIGIAPEAVNRVLLTHLHGDHALGLLADGAPAFPTAEVIVPERDFQHFTSEQARANTPTTRRGAFDVTARIVEAYGRRLVPRATGPAGIAMVPLPGHTPGHSGYRIGTGPESVLIWADMLHLGALQAADPAIGLDFDLDGETAFETRAAGLAFAAREGLVVAGSHLEGFNRVSPSGTGYLLNLVSPP